MEYRWRRLSLERVEERRLLATDLLAEVLPPPNSSFPQDIAVASDDLAYFYVVDPNYARFQPPLGQLYRTDGTPDGTFSIHSDPRSISDFQHALIVGDKLYYRVGSSLFVTSGTPESTVELTDDGRRLGSDGRLVEFDGHVYFIGRDRDSTRTPDQNNYDLMRTDGTFAGTGYVGPGTTTSRHVWIQGVLDGQLVYHVDAGPVVRTLAAADEAPTDIEGDLSGMKGVRIATTFDGNWIGTGGGELVLIDPANGYERTTVDLHTSRQSLPHQFLTTPHGVFFIALTDEGYAVYRTDGTEMGTQRVGDPDAARPTFPRELVWLQESLVFAAHGNLYRYDPTEDSLEVLRTFDRETATTRELSALGPSDLTVVGEELYFAANGEGGRGIWKSDGTAAGTQPVIDIYPGAIGSDPGSFMAVGDQLLFAGMHPEVGHEFWSLNRQTNDVQLLADVYQGYEGVAPFTSPEFILHKAEHGVVFTMETPHLGREPWVTDGTVAGTSLLLDIAPGFESSSYVGRISEEGRFYFEAAGALWSTDGTPSGTQALFSAHDVSRVSDRLIPWKGRVYFTATTTEAGRELWSTDGTAAGTRMETDRTPGEGSSFDSDKPWMAATPEGVVLMDGGSLVRWNGAAWEEVFTAAQLNGVRVNGVISWQGELLVLGHKVFRYNEAFNRFEDIHRFLNYREVYVVPGGDQLLLRTETEGLFLYDLARREIEYLTTRALRDITLLDNMLVGSSWTNENDQFVESLYAMRMEDSELRLLREYASITNTFMEDGQFYAVVRERGQSTWKLITVTSELEIVEIAPTDHSSRHSSHVFFGDRLIYTANVDGKTHWAVDLRDSIDSDLIDALVLATHANPVPSAREQPQLDRNDDQVINEEDIDFLFANELRTSRADLNLDGRVGFADFLTFSTNFGSQVATWSQGDFTADGRVDFSDFLFLSNAFGEEGESPE